MIPRRHRPDEFHVERIKIRRHAVDRGRRAQADDIIVGVESAYRNIRSTGNG
jgi:hypothetical protein